MFNRYRRYESKRDFVNELSSDQSKERKEFKECEEVLKLTRPEKEVYKVLFAAEIKRL
jgi:hypothetical protein